MAHADYMRAWRQANKERIQAYRRERYAAHRAEECANAAAWQRANVLEAAIHRKVASANQRYTGRICAQDIRDLIDRDGWGCHWCHKTISTLRDFTLEHLEPVNEPAALALACHSCNSARLPRWGLEARLSRREYLARRIEKKRAYDDQWRRDHREQSNAAQRARYHAHLEQRRAYFREWQRQRRAREYDE